VNIVSLIRNRKCLSLALVLLASACSSGGKAVAPQTPSPAITLSNVTVECGVTQVFGPATVSVNDGYGTGAALPLSRSCTEGSQVSVTFTPSISSSALPSNAELLFDLLPNASTSSAAVAAGYTTSFDADSVTSALAFTTPALGTGTFLYVTLTAVEPQGD
jgi:hypothetical protein